MNEKRDTVLSPRLASPALACARMDGIAFLESHFSNRIGPMTEPIPKLVHWSDMSTNSPNWFSCRTNFGGRRRIGPDNRQPCKVQSCQTTRQPGGVTSCPTFGHVAQVFLASRR